MAIRRLRRIPKKNIPSKRPLKLTKSSRSNSKIRVEDSGPSDASDSTQPSQPEDGAPGIELPDELPILPLRGLVVYPHTTIPLTVGQPRSIKLVDEAVAGERLIGLVASQDPDLETARPRSRSTNMARWPRFTACSARPMARSACWCRAWPASRWKNTSQPSRILRRGLSWPRRRSSSRSKSKPWCAMWWSSSGAWRNLVPSIPNELINAALNVDDPLQLVYALATYIRIDLEDQQKPAAPGFRAGKTPHADGDPLQRAGGTGAGAPHPDGSPVGDGKDPARVLPARTAQSHPARAGRRRRANGGNRRIPPQDRRFRHARRSRARGSPRA